MRKQFDNNYLDIITPVKLEADWESAEVLADTLRHQKQQYGIHRFALGGPSIGWKTVGFPSDDHYRMLAEKFVQVRDAVKDEGISCGYLNMMTILSGGAEDMTPLTASDGTLNTMTACPLDPVFQRRFAESNALFARIAKPDFIMMEDDYGVSANLTDGMGCFCHHHLDAFAKLCGKRYEREELVAALQERTPESLRLLRQWRQLQRDGMVSLSESVRREVDKENPQIPIGCMQPSTADKDGDMTEAVARALAGPDHTPFCRFYGTLYGDIFTARNVPEIMFHPLYCKQHIQGDFAFYHESDTYPHTRYFLSGKKIGMFMGAAYNMGFDGATFQTVQILDDKSEETAYGKMYVREKARFNGANRIAKQCDVKGVEIHYDPFYNTLEKAGTRPYWIRAVSLFGIPYTSQEAPVAFWDWRSARYADHETVMKYLSKGLFLDSIAARELWNRGYGKYIGVEVGENLDESLLYCDHSAREVIQPPFDIYSKGKNMWAANNDAAGRKGCNMALRVTDPRAEVVTQLCNVKQEAISPALVRFQNELGGRIVVQSLTMQKNMSGALLNYRRQRLYQALIKWCCDCVVMAENEPNIYVIENRAKAPEESGFLGMLTLCNLGEDPVEGLRLHLPPYWQAAKGFRLMDRQGQWQDVQWQRTEDTLTIPETLEYSDYMYILVV